MIKVAQPGLYTTVQDHGRFGFYGVGFPPSGSMDRYSSDVANIIVGNPTDAAVLETTFVGPSLAFEEDAYVAITGADVEVQIDGSPVPLYSRLHVKKGQTLAFGPVSAGVRNYLAVSGGILVEPVLGSRSTYVASHLGGFEGRTLKTGDQLSAQRPTGVSGAHAGFEVPDSMRTALKPHQTIRIVEGLCHYLLDQRSQSLLTTDTYAVSTEANRIGYRLSGNPLTFAQREQPFGAGSDPSNVVNLGYPVGSLQAPSGTELICLMRDAVTGGGYATLATVISVDLDILAQMKFPETVNFEAVDVDQALQLRKLRREKLNDLIDQMAAIGN